MNDTTPIAGALTLELTRDGETVDKRTIRNLVTTAGKVGIAAQLMASPGIGVPTHMGVGTGSVAAALGDTALGTELVRVSLSKSRTNNVVTYTGVFPAGTGTGAITEAGVFNASSAGDLYNRAVFSVLNKDALSALTITWTQTVG